MITPALIKVVQKQFSLKWNGTHGVKHWARVYDTGMKLSEQTGANKNVVQLFSLFHDSKRRNEHLDPNHGPRGAEFAIRLQIFLHLTEEELNLLHQACSLHTKATTHPNITVQTCFDSDRLDLGRVGITPKPKRLCTESAKSKQMIDWAQKRSIEGFVPDNILGNSVFI